MGLTVAAMAQSKEAVLLDENPPIQPPAIFVATMPPCLISVANQYGTFLGISEATLNKAQDFIKEAHQKVPEFKNQVRKIEIDLMVASMKERYEDYEGLLKKLGEVKIEASLFHEGLVKRARKTFSEQDIERLDEFIAENQEVFLSANRLNE